MDTTVRDEYLDLLAWFDIKYTQKEQKYRRLIALNLLCDDGTDPAEKLKELYSIAETHRVRIKEIEQQFKEIEDASNSK